jgi:hypothetical protein
LHRLSQHNLVGAELGKQFANAVCLHRLIVPVPLGETYGAWRRAARGGTHS